MYRTDKQFMKNPATASQRIYIGALPKTVVAGDLEEKFGVHGKILGLAMQTGFAFIQFDTEQQAQSAIQAEHGAMLHGRKIIVKQALDKSKGGNTNTNPPQKFNQNRNFQPPGAIKSRGLLGDSPASKPPQREEKMQVDEQQDKESEEEQLDEPEDHTGPPDRRDSSGSRQDAPHPGGRHETPSGGRHDGPPGGRHDGPPSGGRHDGPPSGGRHDGPPPGNRHDGPPPGNRHDGPPPGNRHDGPPSGGRHDGPPPGNRHDGPPSGGRHDGPSPGGRHDGPPPGGRHDGPTGGRHDGPPPGGRHDGPPPGGRHDGPPSGGRHDGPPPGGRHDGPPPGVRHDGPPPGGRHDGPPPGGRHDGPPPIGRHDGPSGRFEPPQGRHDGPPGRQDKMMTDDEPPLRFEEPSRFDDPPSRYDDPPSRYDEPSRFDDLPSRYDDGPKRDGPRFDRGGRKMRGRGRDNRGGGGGVGSGRFEPPPLMDSFRDQPFYGGRDESFAPPAYNPPPPDRPERNDCEIIVVSKALTEYAEYIEQRLKSLGLVVDLLFPNEDVPIGRVLANISSRGCLYAILVMPQNEEHRSLTLNILHGIPQEHRNMPIEDGMLLITRNFEAYMRGEPTGPENTSGLAMSLADRHPMPMQMLLNLLAENRQMTSGQYEKLLKYLQERRELQVKYELAEGIETTSEGSTSKQAELQSRIMNILNKSEGAAPPAPVPEPAESTGTGVTPSPLLKDPTVQKALDSLMLGEMFKTMGTAS